MDSDNFPAEPTFAIIVRLRPKRPIAQKARLCLQ
jgi:hypothetical protein